MVSKKRFELCEESSKQTQSRMVTLFGQQVYTESIGSGNEQNIGNCLNPLMNDDTVLQLPANRESVFCSQDTIDLSFPLRTKASGPDCIGQRSEKVIISGLIDLNKTPVNHEPVLSNQHQQCFFQDLNSPYIEEMEMRCEKYGLDDNVRAKDVVASPASCCTAENDSCDAIQLAAECLVHISRSNSSSQDQDFLNKPQMAIEEPSYSCDSFELHTLGLRETTPEDEFYLKNKKELGVKVRRGKRSIKNFQKEILPGLASLSRHEIHEDLNILESVLRSRGYKKMQGKASDDDKCRPNSSNSIHLQRYVGRRRRRLG